MSLKIFISEEVQRIDGTEKQTQRYKLEFRDNPALLKEITLDLKKNGSVLKNISKIFSSSGNNITSTVRGTSAIDTATNLVNNLNTYNAGSTLTYSLSTTLNSYGYKDVYIDAVGLLTDTFTLQVYYNDTVVVIPQNPTQLNTFVDTTTITETQLSPIDLFDDETIEINGKIVDIEKLSNVFTDFSNGFNVPATGNNNRLFKHYYDIDINNTFNPNIKVDAYMELATIPYKFGKIQLDGIKVVAGTPSSYKISFFGNTIQLTDKFGDDTLNKLDYKKDDLGYESKVYTKLSQFDYTYNSANFINSINLPSFKDGNIITPLISYTNRDWNYGDGSSYDISTNAGAIKNTELRPAIRLIKIIEAIENKYNITFSRDFFGKASFMNLFMWLNRNDTAIKSQWYKLNVTNAFTGIDPDDDIKINSLNNVTVYRQRTFRINNLTTNYNEFSTCQYTIVPSIGSIPYDVRVLDGNNNVIAEKTNVAGTQSITGAQFARDFSPLLQFTTDEYKLEIRPSATLNFTVSVNAKRMKRVFTFPSTRVTLALNTSSSNTLNISLIQKIEDNIPDMKVTDFLQGIMKEFKLVIRPTSQNTFYVDTLNRFYERGKENDLTGYVDFEEITYDRPEIYKNISFKFQKTNNVLGKKFRELNDPVNDEIGYGDLKAVYASIENKNELKVELPFENMLFERMRVLEPSANAGDVTNISIGQSISTTDGVSFSPNKSKPIIFYNNGIANISETPVRIQFANDVAPISLVYLVGNSDDELLNQVEDTLNFSDDIDPWHLTNMPKNLYSNYWDKWISTIYSLKQRKVGVPVELPVSKIDTLDVNDKIIIGSNRFRISDYKINLNKGNGKLTLFTDIYRWNGYDFDSKPKFIGGAFSPNPYYIIDYQTYNNIAYIYGTFTTFNGSTANRIIKLNIDGSVDTSFNSGTGFNANSFGFQSLLIQPDNKIVVSGDFTSYNGTSVNRIVRLNPSGIIDASFTIGSGFNNITSGLALTTDNKIVVCGSFSQYNGTTANRIARLNTNGTIDTSLVSGTGFNNVTNEVAIDNNNNMYVTGYFNQYNGVTANRIAKILPNGSLDTSFVTGTGFNTGVGQPNGVMMFDNDSILCYGYFTQYNGTSVNRIVRLNSDGTINNNFVIGTGFNASVYSVKSILGDKILVTGLFTEYNGTTCKGAVILNSNGSVYQSFPVQWNNIYHINGYLYGQNITTNNQELFLDTSYPAVNKEVIEVNSGGKYYDILVDKKGDWVVSKVDTGYGVDWIDVFKYEDRVTIKIDEKTSQIAPEVYESRNMDIGFTFTTGEVTFVRIIQKGINF